MAGVSLPGLTCCLVEQEESIDASWKGEHSYCRLSGLLERFVPADAVTRAAELCRPQ